MSAEML